MLQIFSFVGFFYDPGSLVKDQEKSLAKCCVQLLLKSIGNLLGQLLVQKRFLFLFILVYISLFLL